MAYQVDSEDEVEHLLDNNVWRWYEEDVLKIDEKIETGILPKVKYDYIMRERTSRRKSWTMRRFINQHSSLWNAWQRIRKDMDLIIGVWAKLKPIRAHNLPFRNNILCNLSRNAWCSIRHVIQSAWFAGFRGLWIIVKITFSIFICLIFRQVMMNGDEIRLAGVNDYLLKQYPEAKITHTVLADGDLLLTVENCWKIKLIWLH